jgi:hypothetical protein
MKKTSSFFHKKAMSVEVSEEKEWTTTVTVSVGGSTCVQEWTDNNSPSGRQKQIDFRMEHDWLNFRNKELSCMHCQVIGNLQCTRRLEWKFLNDVRKNK